MPILRSIIWDINIFIFTFFGDETYFTLILFFESFIFVSAITTSWLSCVVIITIFLFVQTFLEKLLIPPQLKHFKGSLHLYLPYPLSSFLIKLDSSIYDIFPYKSYLNLELLAAFKIASLSPNLTLLILIS